MSCEGCSLFDMLGTSFELQEEYIKKGCGYKVLSWMYTLQPSFDRGPVFTETGSGCDFGTSY